MIIYVFDLFGTFIFALLGAFRGVKYELDILGVCILSILTGIGGGIIRDLILGSIPPLSLVDETYFIVCIFAALMVFVAAPRIAKLWDIVMLCDALGVGVFTAVGAAKGVQSGLGPIGVLLTGTLTATGGGVLRDILVREIPMVLNRDFYASAAIFGSLFLYILAVLGIEPGIYIWCVILFTTGNRLLAMKLNLKLPRVKSLPESPSNISKKHRNRRN